MELMEVPPSIWPILKVVRGAAGTLVLIKRTEARTRALMGLGIPKSDQLWPPGPLMVASRRREASALVVTWSVPEPSRTITAFNFGLYASMRARMPRRLPSPSSPTSATKRIVRRGLMWASWHARAMAMSAARPVPLSEMPGARRRSPSRRTFISVEAGKTVSRWAESTTISFSLAPRSSPMTLPVLSICTSRPEEARRSFTAAARCASGNDGAGISVRRDCCSLIQARLRANQASAERTSELSANCGYCVLGDGRLLWGTLAGLTGMAKRITQRAACFIAEFRTWGRSIARGLGAESLHFAFGEHARGLLGGVEDASDERVVWGNAVALEPEEDVGLAAQRADLDDLVEAEEMGRDAAVDGIGEGSVFFVISLDDGGGVHAGGSAEGVAADDGIVWRNGGVRGLGDSFAIFFETGEVAVDQAHEPEVDEHQFHGSVADALAEGIGGGVNAVGASGYRPERIGDG